MTPGLVSACGAAALYGAGTVLQAVGVRRGGAAAGQAWPARVWSGRMYVGGLLLDALGFLASIAALRTQPLFVVESVLASSVAITAVLAVLFLGVRLTRLEVGALAGVGAGLVLLAISAREGHAVTLSAPMAWLLLATAVPVAALGLVALRGSGSAGATLLAVTAGLGFGGVGIAARVVVMPSAAWRLVLDPVAWAVVVYGLLSLVAYGLALQRGSVTTTAAVTFTVETVVPAAIGLGWLGDHVRPGAAPVAALGFVLTLGGCILLARHAAEHAAEDAPATSSEAAA
jgi:drug/metabolite transporter (DMT)-like permease